MVHYEEIIDRKNPKNPRQENIAKELQNRINKIEKDFNVKFVTACYLGEADVPMENEEDSFLMCAVKHNKVCKYMLFFN